MSAASQARRRRSSEDLEIVAFEKGNYTSYSACGIPYYLGGVVEDFESLIVRRPEKFRDRYAIDARVRHEVTALDLGTAKVTVYDHENNHEYTEGFDKLVVATGAKPIRPPLPGVDSSGVFGVQVLDHAVAIQDYMKKNDPQHAVVVGGGYIGLEMAEALVLRDLDVTLVELAPQPMTTLDPDMGELVADAMRSMGITVLTNEPVTGFHSADGRIDAVETSERTIPAEIVVLGLGVRPNIDLAQEGGINVGSSGGIAVDQRMRTGIDNVWSVGDCAEKFHRVSKQPVAIALGTHANKEGRVAGVNIGGGDATFPGVVGTAASKVCDLEVARTGLNEAEAAAAGFDYTVAVADSRTRAGYYPGGGEIKTKFVVEKESGRLLGGQIVGKEGAAKRIDVVATALWNEMTVVEILNLDLSYAPPYSPVWDPVLIAARKAWQRVEELRSS